MQRKVWQTILQLLQGSLRISQNTFKPKINPFIYTLFFSVYSDMLNKLVPHEMIPLKSVDEWQKVFIDI